MMRWLLLLGLVFLQTSPDVGGRRLPVQRDHAMDEAEADSLTPRTGAEPVLGIESIEGLPRAPGERAAFLEGFRQAFLAHAFATERVRKRGAVVPAAPLRGGLRLADGEEESAWTARVWLDWFTPADTAADSLARAWPGRGAHVTVTVDAPEGGRAAPAPAVGSVWLRFPARHPVDAAYHQNAGLQVALVVIEAVARARGALDVDRRLVLEGARRVGPGGAR
jgi:hypothetical protein